MDETVMPTWEEAAAVGSLDELHRWADEDFHVDFTDEAVVLSLAANAIAAGVWRNNTEIENIHAGHYKRPGMKEPRGLRDEEMMVGNIETARIVRHALTEEGPFEWWQIVERALFDYDRPYAGTPLSEHVTKKVLAQNTKQVRRQMNWMMMVEDLVGRDRFLCGTALCALSYAHYGSPLWDDTVDAWLDDERPTAGDGPTRRNWYGPWQPSDEVVGTLRTDPTLLDLDTLGEMLGLGLWGAPGAGARWHARHCGDPEHRQRSEVTQFLGIFASLSGLPQMWMYAVARRG